MDPATLQEVTIASAKPISVQAYLDTIEQNVRAIETTKGHERVVFKNLGPVLLEYRQSMPMSDVIYEFELKNDIRSWTLPKKHPQNH